MHFALLFLLLLQCRLSTMRASLALRARRWTKLLPDEGTGRTGLPEVQSGFRGAVRWNAEENEKSHLRPTACVSTCHGPRLTARYTLALPPSMRTMHTRRQGSMHRGKEGRDHLRKRYLFMDPNGRLGASPFKEIVVDLGLGRSKATASIGCGARPVLSSLSSLSSPSHHPFYPAKPRPYEAYRPGLGLQSLRFGC